jgi:hypothetical protein
MMQTNAEENIICIMEYYMANNIVASLSCCNVGRLWPRLAKTCDVGINTFFSVTINMKKKLMYLHYIIICLSYYSLMHRYHDGNNQ